MPIKNILLLMGVSLVFMACAGQDADFEEAAYLNGRGSAADGAKAESLVTPYLNSTDMKTRIEANRLFMGAKVARARISAPKIISNLVHKDSDDTVQVLKGALGASFDGAAAKVHLAAGFAQLEILLEDADFQAIDATTPHLLRDRSGLHFSYGIGKFLYSLVIAASDSGLLAIEDAGGEFAAADCDLDTTGANEFATVLIEARSQFAQAGLDDNELKTKIENDPSAYDALDSGVPIPDLGAPDSSNNAFNDFVQNIQSDVDSGLTGQSDINDLCDYLVTQTN
ncbi:MAG: hypothetical protein COV44_06545 [Deltaproteobacteria bacterium CG11_big_fil_rev_8_21_14_0_20_45_16]|nr:MAG: hypothetical protein COV44_06545 [Deltaproteobacteria bacterium CG11_big_fil_rev_8_21_14_0_20_45_16]